LFGLYLLLELLERLGGLMLRDQYSWFSVLLAVAVADSALHASSGCLRGQLPSWKYCEAGTRLYHHKCRVEYHAFLHMLNLVFPCRTSLIREFIHLACAKMRGIATFSWRPFPRFFASRAGRAGRGIHIINRSI
jgi:hypothetical protein